MTLRNSDLASVACSASRAFSSQHGLNALLLGDVFMRRNPAAIRHRRSPDENHTTIGERKGLGRPMSAFSGYVLRPTARCFHRSRRDIAEVGPAACRARPGFPSDCTFAGSDRLRSPASCPHLNMQRPCDILAMAASSRMFARVSSDRLLLQGSRHAVEGVYQLAQFALGLNARTVIGRFQHRQWRRRAAVAVSDGRFPMKAARPADTPTRPPAGQR